MTTDNFTEFRDRLSKNISRMEKTGLFVTAAPGREIWDLYLESFPPGTNPIFRERTEHDCQCCKHFVRDIGAAVTINPHTFELVSIWDGQFPEPYATVAVELSKVVKSYEIESRFLYERQPVGVHHNYDSAPNIRWEHFYHRLHSRHVCDKRHISTSLAKSRSIAAVTHRGLQEISLGAAETVLSLIEENSLYRGAEHIKKVKDFLKHKRRFDSLPAITRANFSWTLPEAAAIRNTVIGTLLVDLTEGTPMEAAVKAFETKVAPANYKRTSALVTKAMIQKAKEKVAELGLDGALHRRHATEADVPITEVLFKYQPEPTALDPFDSLAKDAPGSKSQAAPKKFTKTDMDTFVSSILPGAKSVDVLVENKHEPNLVNLLTSNDPAPLFAWPNNFSWSYNGEMADAIKDRVKRAGGSVTGALRVSLAWHNTDDLDLHAQLPDGTHVSYHNKRTSQACLDVDMNVISLSRQAVENITWATEQRIRPGAHKIYVHNYRHREKVDVGFVVEMEYQGQVHQFVYDKEVRAGQQVAVVEFDITKDKQLKIISSLPSETASKMVWNLQTARFHPVQMITFSPNHWGDHGTGNMHLFFFVADCRNPDSVRGFYNEFLNHNLQEHRKTFELLASRLKVEPAQTQLAGLGFSLTQRNHVFCRVDRRTYKIHF